MNETFFFFFNVVGLNEFMYMYAEIVLTCL